MRARPRPVFYAAALLLLLPAVAQAQRAPGAARHVVLISIDGLRPDYYLPSSARVTLTPALDALRARGSWAEGVVSQFPSLTYPAHTSIVTGVRPARHGIVHNTHFDPANGSSAWMFDSAALKSPALWEGARAAGLTTAGVSWPVTVGAAIDYLLPETNQAPRDSSWLDLMRRQSTPGLVDAVVARLGGFEPNANRDYVQRDRFAAAAAAHILEKYKPNLLLIHLVEADTAQHQFGPNSPEAVAAINRVDGRVAEIVRAVDAAGIGAETAFIITGDHGFYRVHSAFQPNVVLREAGLLDVDANGRVASWKAVAHRAAIKLKDPSDRAVATRVEVLFRNLAAGQYQGLFRIIGPDEIARYGADPSALLYLEPIEGYTTAAGTAGGFLIASSRRGDHGYTPESPAMLTGLILAGAGLEQGLAIPRARQIDIAPTAARLLGFELPQAEGVPMAGVLSAIPASR
jgi:predicted AlkP superfamily pyrophosphatase or phosphodiesterase